MSEPSSPRIDLYLESRYRKLVRGLPQTIHFCPDCKGNLRQRRSCQTCAGRGRLSEDSVQQIIDRALVGVFDAKFAKFHGAGREDIDVLMLGRGRPFVTQMCGARRRAVDLDDLQKRIHAQAKGRIEVEPLVFCDRGRVAYWKTMELTKTYLAHVRLAAPPVNDLRALAGQTFDIEQRTPQRVAYRRSDLVRKRRVTVVAVDLPAPTEAKVTLRCEHGTYVKEWVSGDDGRTTPSLAGYAGVPAVCELLDVLDLDLPTARETSPAV